MPNFFKVGIVAGEASGDQLGAGLIKALRLHLPDIELAGIGGDKMISEGFESLFPIDRLSVMGLVEPLKRLPELLRIRRNLYNYFTQNQFDLVVGIDSPDFNLDLELKLRQQGIKTVHYVSPSVWAWRQGRIKKIAKAVDHMLTLLPFEAEFYKNHQVPVTFVGHPLAEQLPLENDTSKARKKLGIAENATVVTIMPGSRSSEVEQLGSLFLETAQYCASRLPELQFILPAANMARREQIEEQLKLFPDVQVTLLDGDSLTAMAAANVVLLASGTTALEAMLLKKPMVVSYRMGSVSHAIFSRLIKTKYIALPNLLANEMLVPELLQNEATVENLSSELLSFLENNEKSEKLGSVFTEIHQQLMQGGSEKAASVLVNILQSKPNSC